MMAQDIWKCSERAYTAIAAILVDHGAKAAQAAIDAVYMALDDCLPKAAKAAK